jgi:hypothetical protein
MRYTFTYGFEGGESLCWDCWVSCSDGGAMLGAVFARGEDCGSQEEQ